MANFSELPVIDVTRENFLELWPLLQDAVDSAHFIGIDCELSGLGDRKLLRAPSIEDRYQSIALVAKTRSIIAMGLSCFRQIDSIVDQERRFEVRTFNLMVLCSENYIVEPESLRFLVEHGFDFSKQYSKGISYYRGNDKDNEKSVNSNQSSAKKRKCDTELEVGMRDLFAHIVKSGKSLAVHNGLLDLIFLYQNFYAQLPETLSTFISDVCEMFPGGVYDTKYIAEFVSRDNASYLEFVFRKAQTINLDKCLNGKEHISLSFPHLTKDEVVKSVEFRDCSMLQQDSVCQTKVCDNYKYYGHCVAGKSCAFSHNIDQILLSTEGKGWKKKMSNTVAIKGKVNLSKSSDKDSSSMLSFGGHRAGFDAFMTAFTLAHQLVTHAKIPKQRLEIYSADLLESQALVNRLPLTSKDFPCVLQRSKFAKLSEGHVNKIAKLKTK